MCRVVTYNIHSGVGGDKEQNYRRIGNYLSETGADIVLLQEMDTRAEDRSTESDISDICAGNVFKLASSPALEERGGWYGNAILSRFPILTNETLDVSQDGLQPRNIQTVVVDTPNGPLTVVNTHKGLKKKERRSQFKLLHEYIEQRILMQPMPLVLGGDFNEWQFFTSAFKALNRILRPYKVGATFPARFPVFSLDRLWTSSDIVLHRCHRLKNHKTRLFSDHLPIQGDIRFPQ